VPTFSVAVVLNERGGQQSGTRTIREAVETFSTDRNQTHHERWTMDLIAEAWAACASLMCR
jgi:hypothetical protein